MTKRKEAEILRLIRDGKPLPDSVNEDVLLELGTAIPERSALIDWRTEPITITSAGYDFLDEMDEREEMRSLSLKSVALAEEANRIALQASELGKTNIWYVRIDIAVAVLALLVGFVTLLG